MGASTQARCSSTKFTSIQFQLVPNETFLGLFGPEIALSRSEKFYPHFFHHSVSELRDEAFEWKIVKIRFYAFQWGQLLRVIIYHSAKSYRTQIDDWIGRMDLNCNCLSRRHDWQFPINKLHASAFSLSHRSFWFCVHISYAQPDNIDTMFSIINVVSAIQWRWADISSRSHHKFV